VCTSNDLCASLRVCDNFGSSIEWQYYEKDDEGLAAISLVAKRVLESTGRTTNWISNSVTYEHPGGNVTVYSGRGKGVIAIHTPFVEPVDSKAADDAIPL
jgi:hypothetical protein